MATDADGPPAGAGPEAHLASLRERYEDLAADSDVPVPRRAERLAALELDLLALAAAGARRDPAFGGDRGHAALALASDWRDQLDEQGQAEAAEDAERVIEGLLADEAARWSDAAESAGGDLDAAACFERLVEATQLDREAITRRRRLQREGLLDEQRGSLRGDFLEAVTAEDPDAWARHRWALQLLDGADVVLTSIDDIPPERAAAHLDLVIDDLAWFLRHVATLRGTRRRLRRKLFRLRTERQERALQARLEQRFGTRRTRRFDKVVVGLIFFVLTVLLVESVLDLPFPVRLALLLADGVACGVFLVEFFVKLSMVRGRTSWFLRHALIDLLPSIPFVLLGLAAGWIDLEMLRTDWSRGGRALRLVRVFRLTRFARSFGFLARGFDRLARRYGHLLNHDIVLYPNREERALASRQHTSVAAQAWRLRALVSEAWRALLQDAPPVERPAVARARVEMLVEARYGGHMRRPPRLSGHAAASVRDIPAETMLLRLDALTAEELEADLGQDFVARCARAARMFGRVPLRWLPVIRRCVPRIGPAMSDAEVTAAAAHRIAAELGRHHDRRFWVADLHGTVTPSEFVDRVGTAMVRSSFRPAYRLTLIGTAYLVVRGLIDVTGLPEPGWLLALKSLIGSTLLVLGGVCAVILGLGWWMRRIAGQATHFYEQTAHAQFLALTEAIKGRFLERDAGIFDRRVFEPEELVTGASFRGGAAARRRAFVDAVRSWLVQARAGGEFEGVDEAMQRAILLYRDGLDGALFVDSDLRTTSQLLGNPALRELRNLSYRFGPHEARALQALDLSRPRSSFRGPFLWFSFVAKAITQTTARLIVEYNRHAIPLAEVPHASLPERRRHEAWVRGRSPREGDERRQHLQHQHGGYITTAFTALHFLDDDPVRDREVADRFGRDVLDNLRADRRLLFRSVFGTYPLHARPKEQRVLNLYRLYQTWFGGGRAFLLPLRVVLRWAAFGGRLVRWLLRAIGEIRRPRMRGDPAVAAGADFATALRKIDRMRGPVVWASTWLRVRFDVEYLGVRLPGRQRTGMEDAAWESDLRFLGARPSQVRRVRRQRDAAEADVRRLARLVDAGVLAAAAERIGLAAEGLSREHVRVATTTYRGDFLGLRSLLSCQEILEETTARSLTRAPLPRPWRWRPLLRATFQRWWRAHGRTERAAREAAWRAVVHDVDGAGQALVAWGRAGPERAREEGTALLAEFLRHPGRVSEQLVTLRTVQTLALIDMLNYREHVHRLGDYAATGEAWDASFDLLQRSAAPDARATPAG